MSKPKIRILNRLIVDGKQLKEWTGKRVPVWIKKLCNYKGVVLERQEIND